VRAIDQELRLAVCLPHIRYFRIYLVLWVAAAEAKPPRRSNMESEIHQTEAEVLRGHQVQAEGNPAPAILSHFGVL